MTPPPTPSDTPLDGTPALASAMPAIAPEASMDAAAYERALEACAREPIHIPGSVQPHGALVVLRSKDDPVVLQASENAAALLGMPVTVGEPLGLAGALAALDEATQGQRPVPIEPLRVQMQAHEGSQGLLLEFELPTSDDAPALDSLYPHLQDLLDAMEAAPGVPEIAQLAAAEVQRLTGFHRAMVYRFDADWNGTVIAEENQGPLPRYLELRFPATDIPAQARELYRRQRLRMIPDASYAPVPVLPAASPIDGRPLDLSSVSLRSVSPVHLAYMRNMGTAASMSISILIDGQLWGLISCHHAEPHRVGPRTRIACDFLGQLVALQIGMRERIDEGARRLEAKHLESLLLTRISRAESLHVGLARHPQPWMEMVQATGAAVVTEGQVMTAGRTPSLDRIASLAHWLHREHRDDTVWACHQLPSEHPASADLGDCACGLLAVSISALHPHYVMWFRPELIHSVSWGGQPDKVLGPDDGPLQPRRSFETWTQIVRGQAHPWTAVESDTALSFRNALVDFVLKRAEERAALTEKLEASNKELEAFSYSVSHDLRAPFRHIVGFAQLLGETEPNLADRSRHYLDTIVDAALSAGRLVDDLLNFSQLGRTSLDRHPIDMDKLVDEVRRSVQLDEGRRHVEWRVAPMPPAFGDGAMLRQTVANLVDNALKYTRDRDPAIIEIGGEQRLHETVYYVRDNGVGFDMAYVGKLFGVFQRLHRVEEFEGSGIGLALARRIVDRHGGWIAAEGALNQGATFRFGLPRG